MRKMSMMNIFILKERHSELSFNNVFRYFIDILPNVIVGLFLNVAIKLCF